MFAKCFIDDLFDIAQLFAGGVIVMSNDDKAQVKLGLAAASQQAPLLMHLDYRVRLPVHSYVVGEKHSLIPSVYVWHL